MAAGCRGCGFDPSALSPIGVVEMVRALASQYRDRFTGAVCSRLNREQVSASTSTSNKRQPICMEC
jgi:hypothetical protein